MVRTSIISGNWVLSLIGLCVDTEHTPFGICLVFYAWFFASSLILIYADKKGWVKIKDLD